MENFYGRVKLVWEHNGIVDRFAEGQRQYKESETFIIKSTEKTAEKPRKKEKFIIWRKIIMKHYEQPCVALLFINGADVISMSQSLGDNDFSDFENWG